VNAFILVACATFNASLALDESLTLDWQPTALTYQISYGVSVLLIVAVMSMLGERLLNRYRRLRTQGKSNRSGNSPTGSQLRK
jgi:hypothetical protein